MVASKEYMMMADQLLAFIAQNNDDSKSSIEMYNAWIRQSGVVIANIDMALWALNLVASLQQTPVSLILEFAGRRM